MKKKTEINNDEINLVELVNIAWKGKLMILAAVLISVLSLILYINNQPKNFIATTNITPISSIEENKYTAFNLYTYTPTEELFYPKKEIEETNIIINTNKTENIMDALGNEISKFDDLKTFKLTASGLLNQYIEILNERKLFEDGIRKYKLLDINNYSNVNDYEEAINQLAASIKIISRTLPEKKQIQEGYEVTYTTIKFEFDEIKKWKSVLAYVDEAANKIVKQSLRQQYERLLLSERQKRKYILEDLSEKIENLRIDYESKSVAKILYLKEQSAIAKQLGVAKNTIEVQTLGNQSTLLSTVNTDSPFYLRGYEAIDKEIELIESRINKNAFIEGLDKTFIFKRKLEQDKTLDRAELSFETTPLAKDDNFYAASIKVLSTNIVHKNNRTKIIISVIFGFIIGLFIVIVSNAIQTQKNS